MQQDQSTHGQITGRFLEFSQIKSIVWERTITLG